jgi:hypothetical protein
MPLGPYKNFDECVSKNQDKRSPGGYCAALETKIKGEMTEETINNTHTVEGVEIFAAGTWTDSQGQEREWTEADLDRLLKNFTGDSKESPLPVKVGHTDDAFNARVADELGIPNSLLTGDGGLGAARLGHIVNVRKNGSTLVADFEGVPSIITDMIESGFYNAVSVEIDMPSDDDPHLSGVAILGAELPAVGTLASLDTASIFASASKPWITLSFQSGDPVQIDPEELALEFSDISDKMEELIKGKKGARLLRAFWSEIRRKMSDVTGKRFSSSTWATVIEEQRIDSNIKLPLDLVARICPDCAGEMGKRGLTALKIKNFELPETLKQSLMSAIGEPDEAFFNKCMGYDIGVKGSEKLGFCAWLAKEYTGKWPTLDDGGIEPNNNPDAIAESAESKTLPITEEKFNIQEDPIMGEFVLAPEDLPRLYEALGLDETANIEDVLAAIMAMKGEPMPEEEVPPMGLPMSEPTMENQRIAALEAELKQLKGFNQKLEHERLVMTYAKKAEAWVTMSGTPQERGEELASIHESAGEVTAAKIVASYARAHQAAEDAGVLKSLGATHKEDAIKPDNFQDEIEDYAVRHGVSFEKALAAFSSMPKYRKEFQAYTRRVAAAVNGGN